MVFWPEYLENIKNRKWLEVGFSLLRTDRYPLNNQHLILKFDIVFKALVFFMLETNQIYNRLTVCIIY